MFAYGTTQRAVSASAQTAPGDPTGNLTIPEKDLSRPDAARHDGAQGGSVVDNHEKNLSDKLDASGGVIKPQPGVDPEIVKPAPVPEPNSTPVVPRPGVPGGPPGPVENQASQKYLDRNVESPTDKRGAYLLLS